MKKIFIISMSILFAIGILCGIFAIDVANDVHKIRIKEPVVVEVADGASANKIADMLKEKGVIRHPFVFRQQAKKGGYSGSFKPGTATITPGMSYTDIMQLLTESNRDMVKITIPEGYEVRQIEDKLVEAGLIDRERFDSLLKAGNFNYKFLNDIPDRENQLEGYLFPATYYISKQADEREIIEMMLDAFDRNFKAEYYERAKELNMTVDEIVTLASIIERETSLEEERPLVSGVFYNRIRDNMKLQSCATVEYILKERKAKLSTEDLKIDSKYNTYMYDGLPIGPIACPGTKCIEAALYPADTDAKYFVLGKDGKHIFSKTYEEHLKAKKEAEQ
ncbi:MAG: endolytic transglycosylase MltG [Clostridia bacterium]|nr:endolytic transglycosylase MltG [Clostridia bacterium]